MSWSNKCVISKISRTPEIPPNRATNPLTNLISATEADLLTSQVTSGKLYVPVVTLSINNNIKFSENIKHGFKKTVFWNKYRSERTTQLNKNNLDYMTDPAFGNINRLFAISFMFGRNIPARCYFSRY